LAGNDVTVNIKGGAARNNSKQFKLLHNRSAEGAVFQEVLWPTSWRNESCSRASVCPPVRLLGCMWRFECIIV